MHWQILATSYLVLGTAAYLLRRNLAQNLTRHNGLINGFFFLVILYPLGLIIAAFSSPNLHIGWLNFAFLMTGSLLFPAVNILAFNANKHIDAGLYTIINNITPIITIVVAALLLNEHLTTEQLIGAVIIISSAFLATLPRLRKNGEHSSSGVLLAIASVSILGVAIVFERWMLGRVDFGAYLVYGWGAQALWMAIYAWPDRKSLHILKVGKNFRPILGYGLANAFKGVCFVGALKLSGSASLVSAFTSFLAVTVVISAYFILKERDHLWLKVGSAALGTAGLLILSV